MAVKLLGHPSVWVGVIAQRPQIAIAEEAATAGDSKGNDHAIAHFQILNALAGFNHLAHKLVAQNIARLHRRNIAVVEVQV